ncbi:MAG: glycosyltransferase [Burkholderiales bacterium]
MRVLYVASGLGHGGAETQLIALIGELHRLGHEPAIYLLTDYAPRLEQLPPDGVVRVVDRKKRRLDFGVLRRLRRFIREWRPDIVHGFLFDGNVYARIAAKGLRVSVLNSERNDDYLLTWPQKFVHWPTRHWASAVVANSHAGRRHAMRMFGLPESRTHVVWNGADLGRVDSLARTTHGCYRRLFFGTSDVFVAVVVARIAYQKDIILALDVAADLFERDPRWRVVIVGVPESQVFRGSNVDSHDAYAAAVQVHHAAMRHRDRVHFAGQRDDALCIIADSDVLFSTSRREGFPNAVLEAMGCGTPVVSTAYSDIALILPEPWQVVGSRSPAELASAIERARSEASQLAPKQRQWVVDHATNARSASAMLDVYRRYQSG